MRKWIDGFVVAALGVVLTGCGPAAIPIPPAGPIQFTREGGGIAITYDIPKNCVAHGEAIPITISVKGPGAPIPITHLMHG